MNRRAWLLAGLTVIIDLILIAAIASHNVGAQVVRGIVLEPARSKMAAAWSDSTPRAVEHGYCITRWAVGQLNPFERAVYVIDVMPSVPDSAATPNGASLLCPSPRMPTVHTHLPATCQSRGELVDLTTCERGGPDAWLCSASPPDLMVMVMNERPFDVVQCDRNAFVFSYPPPRAPRDSNP